MDAATLSRRRFGALGPRDMIVWVAFALVLAVAPLIFRSGLAITMLSQMGIGIVACLSFNMLLGQGGMLSFGHAVYSGLATFVAIHVLKAIATGLPVPVSLLPLVGGVAGLVFAIVLGSVTTKKAGTTFSMITLGIGELVYATAQMIPEFFGGEAGVSGNRMAGKAVLGITYGPQIQVYYLIAVYTVICTAAMYAFTRTPLGRMLNAVRDNPERVEFIGYSTQRVRYIAFIISGFFAGVAGGMYAINFEIATAEVVGGFRSGAYLFFTFLGGVTFFFGPIIGAVLMVLGFVLFSELTPAWNLYFGMIFLVMVMFAPAGLAGLIMTNVRVFRFGKLGPLVIWYVGLAVTGLIALLGFSAMVEMIYHLQTDAAGDPVKNFLGLQLNALQFSSWIGAIVVLLLGAASFEWTRRRYARRWGEVQGEIAAILREREVAA